MTEHDLLTEALARPAGERAAFFDEACGSDAELRARVEQLLIAREAPGSQPSQSAMEDFDATIRQDSALPKSAPISITMKEPDNDLSAMGADPDASVPFVFGHKIAQGGMGAILEADDCKFGRKIAVKVMLSEGGLSTEQKLRFVQEAAVLGKLEHPNIVPVHDLGRDSSGDLYYTMKLVKGRTLQDIINDLRSEDPEALSLYPLEHLLTIFQKICDALAFSHSENIIHRDLKPENIMVGEFGEVLVMDWGLSKILDGSAELVTPQSLDPNQKKTSSISATLEGSVMGTPQYMSPEQAAGEITRMDSLSDVYSLGGILYAILTLRAPVEGSDVYDILAKVQAGDLSPITLAGSTTRSSGASQKGGVLEAAKVKPLPHVEGGRVPAALSAVAMKALSLRKKDRYSEVSAFSADIDKWQRGFATSAEQAGLGKQLVLLIRRNKAVFFTATTAWLLITALAIWFVIGLQESERETRHALGKSQISLAEAAYLAGDGQRALKYLDQCPPPIRDTHWHYLHRYSDESIYRRPKPRSAFRSVIPDPLAPGRSYLYADDLVIDYIDSRSGEVIKTIDVDTKCPSAVSLLSPDGKFYVFADRYSRQPIEVYRTDTFELVRTLEQHENINENWNGFFLSDSRTLVVSTNQITVQYDIITEERRIIEGVRARAPDPKKPRWYGIESNSLLVYDADDEAPTELLSSLPPGVDDLSVSHDSRLAALARNNGTIAIYDLRGGELIKTLNAYRTKAYRVTFSKDSPTLLSYGRDGNTGALHLWSADADSQFPLRSLMIREEGSDASISWIEEEGLIQIALSELNIYPSPSLTSSFIHKGGHRTRFIDETTLAFSSGREGGEPVLATYNLETKKIEDRLIGYNELVHSRTREVSAAAWLHYHSRNFTDEFPILKAAPDIDIDVGRPPHVPLHCIDTLGISPRGRFFAAASPEALLVSERDASGDWKVILERLENDNEIPSGLTNQQINLFFPASDRPLLLASFIVQGETTTRRVYHWYDLDTDTLLRSAEEAIAAASMLINADGNLLISGAPDGAIYGKDPLTLDEKFAKRVHDQSVNALALRPDGKVLATSDNTGLIRLWKMEQSRPTQLLRELLGNLGSITSLEFSPGGNSLVSHANFDVRLFDLSDLVLEKDIVPAPNDQPSADTQLTEGSQSAPDTQDSDTRPLPNILPLGGDGERLTGPELARVIASSEWTEPAPVTLENASDRDEHYEPYISRDGKQIYFSLWQNESMSDVMIFKRTDDPSLLSYQAALDKPINTPERDTGLTTARNGTLAAVGYSDAVKAPLQIKLYRLSPDNRYQPEDNAITQSLASSGNDASPTLTEDGLTIVFSSNRSGSHQLWEARRESIDVPFDAPYDLSLENKDNLVEKFPSLSADGKLLLYSMTFKLVENVFYSVRETLEEPFSPPVRLDDINDLHATDSAARISPDGRFLYFTSRRNHPGRKLRLYVSERIEPEKSDEASE
ncbi:MAG: protein kinase [Verrucomicrobiales bacterium]|nr:protein kinase [Verrucomicrobiales bacterium]